MKYCVVIAWLCAAVGQPQAPVEKPDPRAELPSAIQHAWQLLNDKEYSQFLEQFATPAELKRIIDTRGLEDLVAGFAKEKARSLMAALEQIKGTQPKISADGKLAEYAVDIKDFSQKKIVFERIDGLWYLRN